MSHWGGVTSVKNLHHYYKNFLAKGFYQYNGEPFELEKLKSLEHFPMLMITASHDRLSSMKDFEILEQFLPHSTQHIHV